MCSVMTRVRQSVVGVVIFSHFFLHETNLQNLVNIDGQCTCMHFNVRLTKFDQQISDMTAVSV